MFVPKYILSGKLLKNLTEIERFYGQIETLRIPKELWINLKRNNLIRSTYISNSIEGNPLGLPEVTNLLLGDRVPINRDEKEIQNYFGILNDLSSFNQQDLNQKTALDIHRKLMTGVSDEIAGSVRNLRVVIGTKDSAGIIRVKHEPPFHQSAEIISAMKDLMEWINLSDMPVPLKAGIFHHQFVFIHPFIDGNGRVCRLLTALIFLRGGYAIDKYFLLDDFYDVDRNLHSDSLHSGDFGDKTTWLEYFTDGVKYSLQGALEKAKKALSTITVSKRPSPKEKQVLEIFTEYSEITTAMIVEQFDISRQQAHKLLKALVEFGLINKMGSTKSSYYVLRQ